MTDMGPERWENSQGKEERRKTSSATKNGEEREK